MVKLPTVTYTAHTRQMLNLVTSSPQPHNILNKFIIFFKFIIFKLVHIYSYSGHPDWQLAWHIQSKNSFLSYRVGSQISVLFFGWEFIEPHFFKSIGLCFRQEIVILLIFILLILFVMRQDLNYISSVCLKFTMYTYHFILELIEICWSLSPQS